MEKDIRLIGDNELLSYLRSAAPEEIRIFPHWPHTEGGKRRVAEALLEFSAKGKGAIVFGIEDFTYRPIGIGESNAWKNEASLFTGKLCGRRIAVDVGTRTLGGKTLGYILLGKKPLLFSGSKRLIRVPGRHTITDRIEELYSRKQAVWYWKHTRRKHHSEAVSFVIKILRLPLERVSEAFRDKDFQHFIRYWIPFWFVIFFILFGPNFVDVIPALGLTDKWIHFIEYFILMFVAYRAFSVSRREYVARRALFCSAVFVLSFGAADEIMQGILPNRDSSFLDYLANVGGISAFILIRFLGKRVVVFEHDSLKIGRWHFRLKRRSKTTGWK